MNDTVKHWESEAGNVLLNKTIVSVRYMTEEEVEHHGWNSAALIIILNDGTAIYPSADDEGNDAGALFTTSENIPVIPVI